MSSDIELLNRFFERTDTVVDIWPLREESMSDNPNVVDLLVHCWDAPECTVAFEPEGAVLNLKAGDRLAVEISPSSDGIEISYMPGGLSISGAAGSTRVWNKAGDLLEPRFLLD